MRWLAVIVPNGRCVVGWDALGYGVAWKGVGILRLFSDIGNAVIVRAACVLSLAFVFSATVLIACNDSSPVADSSSPTQVAGEWPRC